MTYLVSEELEDYAIRHGTPFGDLYEQLREQTYRETDLPQMQVGPLEGRLLTLLVRLCGARSAVEVGTFTGYSSLCIAEGLPDDGTLVTCDIDEQTTAIARSYWDQATWGRKIELRLGPALATLADLEGPIDFAFIDADKENYIGYWEALVPLLRPGGLVVVDNVLWSGRVLDPQTETDRAIVAFNSHAQADDRIEQVLLTVRDGVLLGRKR